MRSPSSTRFLPRLAVLLAACGTAACSGCGALGLYSLGHSLLSHNHVLKPILPDDVDEEGQDQPLAPDGTGFTTNNGSSRDGRLPMERCRGSDDARPTLTASDAASGETIGEEPCHP